MEIYSYTIKLIDPLFFAREGISGAFTPPYIHSTALNYAVALAMGRGRQDQPYLMAEANGGRDTPCYENSLIEQDFYFTPARLRGTPTYLTEVVKGDGDRFIQIGYGSAKIEGVSVGRNEVLKAYRIYLIAAETEFEGYLYTKNEIHSFPQLIRLGSFRGLAILAVEGPKRKISKQKHRYCDHPVDSLVVRCIRGISVSMLPYIIVDQPLVEEVWEIEKYGKRVFVASLSDWEDRKARPQVKDKSSIIV